MNTMETIKWIAKTRPPVCARRSPPRRRPGKCPTMSNIALLAGPFPHWEQVSEEATRLGWDVDLVQSAAEAFQVLARKEVVVAVMPTQLPDGPADNLLLRARASGFRTDFVLLGSGQSRDERALLLDEGADEVFDPPADVGRILSRMQLLKDRRELIDGLGLVVHDPRMLELFERILRVAPLKVTALITGESGTGKEMLAQAIHRASDRRNQPFVAVNVGALPENLLESELFGHERGAFTSADSRRIGRFELAHTGTLFLDEIGEMSMASQVNLLRVLEEEEFLRVGGSKTIRVDVRIVAATNRNLEELVREGRFRRDLYYRLKVVHFEVPALRERPIEIPILLRELAKRSAARHHVQFPGFTKEAIAVLTQYEWPGNVRELRNLVDGFVALRPDHPIRVTDLPSHLVHGAPDTRLLPTVPHDRDSLERELILQTLLAIRAEVAALREAVLSQNHGAGVASTSRDTLRAMNPGGAVYPTRAVRVESPTSSVSLSLQELEKQAVERALREAGHNRRRAAEALGISERTLYRRIREFGMSVDEDVRNHE